MPRVATCKDCGAQFKVPDSTTATRAKCKKCGGVLEIPPADGGAPAAKAPAKKAAPAARKAAAKAPAKAAAKAPAKAGGAPTASKKPRPGAKAGAKTGGKAKAAGRSGGARKAGGRAKGGAKRGGRGGGEKEGSKTGLIVGIVAAVVILGGAGWYFTQGGDTPTDTSTTTDTASTDTASTDTGATDTGASTDTGSDVGGAEEVVKAPAAPAADSGGDAAADPVDVLATGGGDTGSDTGTPAADLAAAGGGADDMAKAPAPAAEKAPPAAKPVETKADLPDEPLPTLIAFEELPPVLGGDAADLAEWTATIKELYLDNGGATGRKRKGLLGKVRDLDPVDSVPAYLNALNGTDIADELTVKAVFTMVRDWQDKVARKPQFSFPADVNRMDVKTQNLRVKVLEGWYEWWTKSRASGQDQEKLDGYRLMVEEAIQARG